MLVIDPILEATRSSAGSAADCVGLRMRESGGQVVLHALPFGKTTLGSSAKCTLRIQQTGVQPMHCLIQRDLSNLTVQRWAEPGLINGAAFERATLSPGDWLTIGTVEFEVIMEGSAKGQVSLEPVAEVEVQEAGSVEVPRDAAAQPFTILDQCDELLQDREPGEEEVPAWFAQEASTLEAKTELKAKCDELRKDVANLSDKLSQATQTRDALAEEISHTRREREDMREEHTQVWDKVAQLNREITALNAERSQVANENASLIADADQVRSELESLRLEIGRLRAADAAQARHQQALNENLHSAHAELEQLRGELNESLAGHANQHTEVAARDAEIGELRDEIARLRQQAEQAAAETCRLANLVETGTQECERLRQEHVHVWSKVAQLTAENERLIAVETSKAVQPKNGQAPKSGDVADEMNATDGASTGLFAVVAEEHPFIESFPAESEAGFTGQVLAKNEETVAKAEVESSDVWHFRSESQPAASTRAEEEDGVADNEPTEPVTPRLASHSLFAPPPRLVEPGATLARPVAPSISSSAKTLSASTSDDEESIEDYMAKLMQRLRGDGAAPLPPSSQAPALTPATAAATRMLTDTTSTLNSKNELSPLPVVSTRPIPLQNMSAEEFKPADRAPERPVDLQSLRDLANASARSAIAVHSTKVHRRSAATKVIVSALAAMTSLWLMLQSPDWRNIEFIFACVLLIVAGYWVSQTIKTFIDSIRAGHYDGNDYDWEGGTGPQNDALPIDIERDRW